MIVVNKDGIDARNVISIYVIFVSVSNLPVLSYHSVVFR